MKHSKRQRKFLNQMRGMGDVPWPARRYKYPPTLHPEAHRRLTLVGTCKRPVGEQTVKTGRLKRKRVETVVCGGNVYVRRRSNGGHRVFCEDCRARREQARTLRRLAQRFARLAPREQAVEQRREASRMKRLLRRSGK